MAKGKNWDALILEVMKDSEKIHYTEIAQRIIDSGKLASAGQTPAISVNTYLNGKLKDKVVKLGGGYYILKEKFSTDVDLAAISQSVDGDEEEDDSDNLITAYGRFWSRELLNDNKFLLLGSSFKTRNATPVDFSDHAGVYILHKGYTPVYAGQAKNLSKRLEQHTSDLHRNRWDYFSWFSVSEIDAAESATESKKMDNEAIIDTLEALLIEILGTERNRQSGHNFDDKEFEQITSCDYYNKQVMTSKKADK